MIGLAYKDFLVMKKQLRYYAVFFLVYGVMAASGIGFGVLAGLVCVMGLTLPMSSIAYDEQARWDKFAASTPVGRGGIVAGKYLFVLITLAVTALFVAALTLALRLLGLVQEDIVELLLTIAACTGVALVMNAVSLPLMLKFGAEKSRIISMAFFALVFGSFFFVGFLVKNNFLVARRWLLSALPVLLAILAVGGFALSYCISRAIYEKKEL